jgi:hypothetical protein
MSDEPKKRSLMRWLLWRALFILVLYPLSSGPAAWLMEHSGAGPAGAIVYMTVYRPIFALGSLSDTANEAFEGYIGLWIDIERYR